MQVIVDFQKAGFPITVQKFCILAWQCDHTNGINAFAKLKIESPEQIWSGDETGVQTVPKEEKYLGEVNEPLYSTVSADQGETSTVLSFVNAVGCVCPPVIIHKDQ